MYTCEKCPASFVTEASLIRHRYLHENEALDLPKVEFVFGLNETSNSVLEFGKDPTASVAKKKNRQIEAECHYCGLKLAWRNNLRRHIRDQHGIGMENNKSASKVSLTKTKSNAKPKLNTLGLLIAQTSPLPILSNRESDSPEVQEINTSATGSGRKSSPLIAAKPKVDTIVKFRCKRCGCTFAHENDLKRHVIISRTQDMNTLVAAQQRGPIDGIIDVKEFRCKVCDDSFPTKRELYEHLHVVHLHLAYLDVQGLHLREVEKDNLKQSTEC